MGSPQRGQPTADPPSALAFAPDPPQFPSVSMRYWTWPPSAAADVTLTTSPRLPLAAVVQTEIGGSAAGRPLPDRRFPSPSRFTLQRPSGGTAAPAGLGGEIMNEVWPFGPIGRKPTAIVAGALVKFFAAPKAVVAVKFAITV